MHWFSFKVLGSLRDLLNVNVLQHPWPLGKAWGNCLNAPYFSITARVFFVDFRICLLSIAFETETKTYIFNTQGHQKTGDYKLLLTHESLHTFCDVYGSKAITTNKSQRITEYFSEKSFDFPQFMLK